jgi:general secretion pathway protein A
MPANADVAVVLNPQLSAREFLITICEELGIAVPADRSSIKALIDTLNHHLLDAHSDGRRTILVVDEAQNLAPDVLEEVRLLTNLETAKQKLLQIVLVGQPELRDLLARNDLRQLAQRITGRYHLEPLSRDETAQYVDHRLKVAGALGEVFDAGAKREVFRLSQGVPRLINVICDRALLGAYTVESRRVNRRMVRRAAIEITGKTEKATWPRWAIPAIGMGAAVVIVAGFLQAFDARRNLIDASIDPPVAEVLPESVPEPAAIVVEAADIIEDEGDPEVSLDAQLRMASELTGSESALMTLLDLWGVDYQRGQRGCTQAAAEGYECLSQRGSWSGLKQFDRPAILTLVDGRGSVHDVVLIAINGAIIELSIGGVVVTHTLEEVTDMWFGEFLLLWRPPNGSSEALGPGSSGPGVAWLRQSLAAIDIRYQTAASAPDVFDENLAEMVRLFQRDNRLDVDGLAGHQTQIIINTLLNPDSTPRLLIPRLAQE